MYCIRCGVELAEHETCCPLCKTKVVHPDFIHPDAPAPYPKDKVIYKDLNRNGVLFILSILFSLAAALMLVCDLSQNHAIIWSGYAIGGLGVGYLFFVFPLWFRRRVPAVFAAVDFSAVLLLLWYINTAVGGSWFLSFAMPTVLMLAAITCAFLILYQYFRSGLLWILGGAFILLGVSLVGIELLMQYTFSLGRGLVWSVYPLVVFALLGILLLVIASSSRLRGYLERKFFL
ncbi:MAG: hypothetical protein HFE66_05530 [Clostridiales bacterium]|jgi:hypothetical protein|nr:hypothetical protein [Clostridiales bacterium]